MSSEADAAGMSNARVRRGKRGRCWRLAGLLLFVVALSARAEPPCFKLPGRKPGSKEPWGAFLGRAAHLAVGKQYIVEHPFNVVFLNDIGLADIVKDGKLGEPDRLPKFIRLLRPDITDATDLVLFEIKPDDEASRRQGREQAMCYLEALNAAAAPHKRLVGGAGFEGSLLLEFESGGALWKLSWRTPEPGVTLYRWSYRREKRQASWKERMAQKEEPLPMQEVEQRGAQVEQVLKAVYERGELPKDFEGQVFLPVDCR